MGDKSQKFPHQFEYYFGIARTSTANQPSIFSGMIPTSIFLLPVQFLPRSGLPSKPVSHLQSLICTLPGPLLPELAGQRVHCKAWPGKSLYLFCGQAAVNGKFREYQFCFRTSICYMHLPKESHNKQLMNYRLCWGSSRRLTKLLHYS